MNPIEQSNRGLMTYKVILIGDSVVGKSSIVQSLVQQQFFLNTVPTLGVDIQFKDLTVQGHRIQLQLWDTAGQDRYKSITRAYYKGADAVLLVYDITDYNTFVSATNYWYQEMDSHLNERTLKVLVGNKIDKLDRTVQKSAGEQFSNHNELSFFEITASEPYMVQEMFVKVIQKLNNQNPRLDQTLKQSRRLNGNQQKQKNCFEKFLSLLGL